MSDPLSATGHALCDLSAAHAHTFTERRLADQGGGGSPAYLTQGGEPMDHAEPSTADRARDADKRYTTLLRMLALDALSVATAMQDAAQLLGDTLASDKFDVFQIDARGTTLVALGTSDTPLGAKQHAVGLDRLPLANGGREVETYLTGEPRLIHHAEQDPRMLPAILNKLGVRAEICAPMLLAGEKRGVLLAVSQQPETFTTDDLAFLQAAAQWVSLVLHRAELIEQLAGQAAPEAALVEPVAPEAESYAGDVTDAQWAAVERVLPPSKQLGRPLTDLRLTLNGILYVLRQRIAWRAMPRRYGSYVTCWRRYIRWQGDGVWAHIEKALAQHEA